MHLHIVYYVYMYHAYISKCKEVQQSANYPHDFYFFSLIFLNSKEQNTILKEEKLFFNNSA